MKDSKTIFLSWDFGLRGDFQGLFTWLDRQEAKECGNNLAVFSFKFDSGDFLDELEIQLKNEVKFEKRDRVYAIWREAEADKLKGKFLFGSRKTAPWEGFAARVTETVDGE